MSQNIYTNPVTGTSTSQKLPTITTTTTSVPQTTGITEKIQPQPYPLQGQALPTGWGQYPQGAYYPPPVQKPQEFREEVPLTSGTTTTTTTTQYVEVAPVSTTGTTYTSMAAPVSTVGYTTSPLVRSVIGPNTHGVPENFPWLACDASCHKCHGTGYKKKLITRKWAPCKKCAHKYGTDIHRVDLKNLPPLTSHECSCPIGVTSTTGIAPTTMIGTMPTTTGTTQTTMMGTMPATNPSMVVTTAAGTLPGTTGAYGTTRPVLPSGFQTLPANPQCVKCSGTGYRRSRKSSNWKGCKTCARQYGTNLTTVVIPATANTMVTTGTSATGATTGTNIIY